uniref:Uncharacterized protein n=1 Tax=Anguilla anguilla TaxID=7936 RepID=A0A0E9W244_ANGAN
MDSHSKPCPSASNCRNQQLRQRQW